MEQEPTRIHQVAERLNPEAMQPEDVQRIASGIHAMQRRIHVDHPKGNRFLLGSIDAAELGPSHAHDSPATIPVYKAGGIIARDKKTFLRFTDTLRHTDYPDAVLV